MLFVRNMVRKALVPFLFEVYPFQSLIDNISVDISIERLVKVAAFVNTIDGVY